MGLLGTITSSVLGAAVKTLTDKAAVSSNWGSVHPDLLATFVQIGTDGNPTGLAFKALVKDGSIDQTFEWTSPFENLSSDKLRPTLTGAVQSGAIAELSQALSESELAGLGLDGSLSGIAESAKAFKGKSGVTKLNSRQIYAGHSPLEITMTLLFRAWQDPESEVAAPFAALQQMAYPNRLADNAVAEGVKAGNGTDGAAASAGASVLAALFPSDAPSFVAFYYKGECYKPMIIESVGKPLDAPYSVMGDIFLEVPVKLESYQSLDFADIQAVRSGSLGAAVGKISSEAINRVSSLFKKK